jgi:tetratricopeptide (TPR) repeat protein
LAGVLYFVGTLFPVLGFLNVFPFTYSFVADHFQYLAGLGIITLASAGTALLLMRWRLWNRPTGYVVCLVPLAVLANLTWRQSRMYTDIETLYQTTIDRNPGCWMAYNNLGLVLRARGQWDEAVTSFRKVIELNPGFISGYCNLGVTLVQRRHVDEAIAQFHKALEIEPDSPQIHYDFGLALNGCGRPDDAIAEYRKALEIKPDYADAHNNLGLALVGRGRFDEAIAHYRTALQIKPDYTQAYNNLGISLAECGRLDEAIVHYQKALQIVPDYADAHNNLGNALARCGRVEEAIVHYQKALKLKPDYEDARNNLDLARSLREGLLKVLAGRRESLRSRPDDLVLLNDIAWTLATNPDASIRNGAEAVALAQRAVRLSQEQEPAVLGTLAAAYAETGRFSEAVQTDLKALDLATQQNKPSLAKSIKVKILLYEAGTPFREIPQFPAAGSIQP